MADIKIPPVSVKADESPQGRAWVLDRLTYHRGILEANGIAALSDLGTLNLSGSLVAPAGKIVYAPPPVAGGSTVTTVVGAGTGAMRLSVNKPMRDSAGELYFSLRDLDAYTPTGAAVLTPRTAGRFPIENAYFCGSTVNIAPNTFIELAWPQRYLFFIAEQFNVGHNVTVGWAHPRSPRTPPVSYLPGNVPATPGQAATGDDVDVGVQGEPGASGQPGGQAPKGDDAPEFEFWLLRMTGSPIFDVSGQDGWQGGRGQDGGKGGQGATGVPETYDFLGFCKSAAGVGGKGGTGGNGGTGGKGGAGGHGGRLRLCAPRDVLTAYGSGGFSIATAGGAGGPGGNPGSPGLPGTVGERGPHPKDCKPEREHGPEGDPGQVGAPGDPGTKGALYDTGAVTFLPITEHEFREALTRPALVSANPTSGVAGTEVTLSTLRVQPTDTLLFEGQPIPMTVVADTAVTFVVPTNTTGATRVLQIRQTDGTLSNRLTFYVEPHLSAVGDKPRAVPGSTVALTGSGFAQGALVRVNGEDMPDVKFVDGSTMTFTLHRPQGTQENPSGEVGRCTVILPDGFASNTVEFTIDTLHVVVLGDSVAWGQGLRTHEKFTTQVEKAFAASRGGIKCYTSNFAHSGATIGIGDPIALGPIDGEVPTSYPTVMQQLDLFTGDPEAVDLVMVTAGLNDLNVRNVLNPLNTPAMFAEKINQYCHRDIRTLLDAIAHKFPDATIVATGYYPMISEDSDTVLLTAFFIGLGFNLASLPGGVLGAALIPQIVTNCRAFYELSTTAITSAVDDVNDSLPAPRVLFADAGFRPVNAALASEPWLYGINPNLTPQDIFTSGDRAAACHLNASRTDVFQCERASIGHPNAAGATAYANAIVAALRTDPGGREAALPPFPPGFLFGVATSSMQNEGGIENNDWYTYTTSPEINKRVATIVKKGNGHVTDLVPPGDADKHADLAVLTADLDLAAGLGVNSYRFSVEWARLMPSRPSHSGPLTDADLDMDAVAYYDHVLDELAARSMTPVLTLNHFSLPLWVLDPPRKTTFSAASFGGIDVASADDPDFRASMRGWENPDVVDEYVRLVSYLAARWANRITWWATVNEPVGSMIGVGYFAGVWPPGFTGDAARGKDAYFNLIRAHLRAYEAIKAVDNQALIGFAHAMLYAKVTTVHSDDVLGDQDAARNQFDYFYNWHMLDTVIDGHLDIAIARRPGNRQYLEGVDFANYIGIDPNTPWTAHCDFVGLNYYRSVYVFADPAVSYALGYSGGRFDNDLSKSPQIHQLLNPLGWEINPGGFGSLLRELHDRYGLPVLVTENGIPQADDRTRGAYIAAHLTELLAAIAAGVEVRGYMYWTLADNWELQEGYSADSHFGLFTVDRSQPSQPRQLTDGAQAYAYAIATNGVAGVRERFGAITPAGDQVRPPGMSPALLTGTLDGHPFEVELRTSPDGRMYGLLWEQAAGRLRRVRGSFDPALRALNLAHPAGAGAKAGDLTGQQASAGGDWSGTLTRDGATLSWTARQDTLVGIWAGQGALPRVKITHAPGGVNGYVGSWMADALPRGWEPLSVTITGNDVILEFDDGRVVATLTGTSLSGTITVRGQTASWTATRLRDPLG